MPVTREIYLIYRLLGASSGYGFLSKMNFIENELLEWHEVIFEELTNLKSGNMRFVVCIELYLEELLVTNSYCTLGQSKYMPYLSKMPAHFYGELCQTPEGCNLIRKKGYCAELIETLKSWKTRIKYLEIKAALWAIVIIFINTKGYIMKNINGSRLLCQYSGIINELTHIVREHSSLSIRGY